MDLSVIHKILNICENNCNDGDYLEISNFLKKIYDERRSLLKNKYCFSCGKEKSYETISVPVIQYKSVDGNRELFVDYFKSNMCLECFIFNNSYIYINECGMYVNNYVLTEVQKYGFNELLTKEIVNKYFDKNNFLDKCKRGLYSNGEIRSILRNNNIKYLTKHRKGELINILENNL